MRGVATAALKSSSSAEAMTLAAYGGSFVSPIESLTVAVALVNGAAKTTTFVGRFASARREGGWRERVVGPWLTSDFGWLNLVTEWKVGEAIRA